MKFVHPEILWGLTALSIPILVHLFNFRRFKRVLFSNVGFLQEIKQETKSKSKLKHLLILLSRMLALTALVFAFAQPYLPLTQQALIGDHKTISIYLDNSFSMDGNNGDGRLLDLAKNKAFEIVNSYGASDQFQLLTNDFEGRHQRLVSQEEINQLIQEVTISNQFRTIDEVLQRQQELFTRTNAVNRYSYLINDLQRVSMPFTNTIADSTWRIRLVPTLSDNTANVYADSIWFGSPVRQLNTSEEMIIRVRNSGQEAVEELPIEVSMNGEKKSVATVSMPGTSQQEQKINYSNTSTGSKFGAVRLNDSYIKNDDSFYFSYNVATQLLIYHLRGSAATTSAIAAVFDGDPYFRYQEVSDQNIDYGQLSSQNLVILDEVQEIGSGLQQELQKFVAAGGSLLLIPSTEGRLESYNQLLQILGAGTMGALQDMRGQGTKVQSIALDHPLYRGIFDEKRESWEYPRVDQFHALQLNQQSNQQILMTLQNGLPYLTTGHFGSGKVYTLASALQLASSNFITHGLFSTTLLRISEFAQHQQPLYYTLGSDDKIVLKNIQTGADGTFKLRHIETGTECIPEHRNAGGDSEILIKEEPRLPGNYEVILGDSVVAGVSFNLDRKESDTRQYSLDELGEQLSSHDLSHWLVMDLNAEHLAANADTLADGKTYWYQCIILALIFLAIEIILIKFWR